MAEGPNYRVVRSSKAALPEQVARQILDLIASKQLRIGDRLPPLEELARHLGVSRTVLREAMKLLDAWGIMTVKQGVGTFVSGLTKDALSIPFKVSVERSEQALRDLHQLREALEPAMVAIAAEKATSEHLQEMEEALRTMDRSLNNTDEYIDEYIEADVAFHVALAKATGNDLFLMVIYPVIDLLRDTRRLATRAPGGAARAQAFHQKIFEEVKNGHADEAKEAMKSHLDQVWREIQAQMTEVE